MKNIAILISIIAFNCQVAMATTAVLCGDATKVDMNNNAASVWLIFDNDDSRSADEITVTLKGLRVEVKSTEKHQDSFDINLEEPQTTITVSERDIESPFCDGERQFSVQLGERKINKCRCFAD